MTDQYYKDMSALTAMIAVLPAFTGTTATLLTDLNNRLLGIYTKAPEIDVKKQETMLAYDDAYPDDAAGLSDGMRKKLSAIDAAGRGGRKSRMQLVASLLEDGTIPQDENNAKKWVKALRSAFDGDNAANQSKRIVLASTATDAGQVIHVFCDLCKQDQSGSSGPTKTSLLASALDLFLPIAKARGLAPEHVTTLDAMRDAIRTGTGHGEGSTVWPSSYVSSSSSSSGSGG